MAYINPSDGFKARVSAAWGLAKVNKTTVPALRSPRDGIDAMLIGQVAEDASAVPRPRQCGEGEA